MAIQYSSQLDRTFHALGDGTRRAMLEILSHKGPSRAGDLGKPFKITQPTASKHLRVLEQAGLVERSVKGRVHEFRLVEKPLKEAEVWLNRHQQFWAGVLDRLPDVLDQIPEGGND